MLQSCDHPLSWTSSAAYFVNASCLQLVALMISMWNTCRYSLFSWPSTLPFNFSWDYNSAFRDGTWWLCKRRCQGQCRLQVQVLLRSQSPEVCSLARKLPTAVLQMLRKSPGLPSLQSVFLYQSVHQKLSQFKDLLHSLLVFKMAPMHYG